jgi:hypothetical protein
LRAGATTIPAGSGGGGGEGFVVRDDPQIVQTVPWSLHTAEQSGHQLLRMATEFVMAAVGFVGCVVVEERLLIVSEAKPSALDLFNARRASADTHTPCDSKKTTELK